MRKNDNTKGWELGSGKRTPEEERAIRSKGGKASAEARKRKKNMMQIAQIIADSPIKNEKNIDTLKSLGLKKTDATHNAAVVAGIYKKAVAGNIQAVEKWQELTNVAEQETKVYELPARVLGKDYVDINRNIVPNKSYVFEGGRGSLKSSFISLKIIELIKNNPNMHACVIRKVAGTLRDSVYAQIKWAINILGLDAEFDCKVSPLEIKYIATGQIIYFRGVDDPIKLKSIKPSFGYLGIIWKEEKDQLSGPSEERSINQSVLRGGMESYDFSSYNPPKSKANWVNREKLVPDENRIICESNYKNAPLEWLGQKFIDDAEHLKEVNPDAYEHEYMGVANGDGGNVFENIELREITDKEIQSFDTIYQGVDWGWYPDPFAFVRLYYDKTRETIYFIDEHIVNKQKNDQTGNWIIEKKYDDYEIACDSAEHKSTADYRDMGLPARNAIKGPGSVEYGMKWLMGRHIVIDPRRTPKVKEEFTEYEYERDKDGNVISGYPDEDNHTIDATRYALEKFYNKRGNKA